jgi:hypothetical protein
MEIDKNKNMIKWSLNKKYYHEVTSNELGKEQNILYPYIRITAFGDSISLYGE